MDRYAVVIIDHEGNAQTHAKYVGEDSADNADFTAGFINAHGNYKAVVVGY